MGKVAAFEIAGLTLIFRSADHHPPHFHVRKDRDWEIRVYIDTSTEENGLSYDYKFPKNRSSRFRGLSAYEEKQLLANVIQFRIALLSEWEQKVSPTEVI